MNQRSVTIRSQDSRRLDNPLRIRAIYDADREAMLAALRVVLGLPKRLARGEE